MSNKNESHIIANIISNRTGISLGNSNSISAGNSTASPSVITASRIKNHQKKKVMYPALYHVITLGSKEFKCNHFTRKECSALDREINSKN